MTIVAAADGSALGNPGPAGWAWFVDEENWMAGGWPHATNNQAELMAVLSLLTETAGTTEPLHVLCDSQYVINCLTKWMPGWKRKGWKKADGKPVLNRDLIEQLDAALSGRKVTFEWVKGHAGHDLNERVDDLARDVATAYQRREQPLTGPGFQRGAMSTPAQTIVSSPVSEPSLFDLFETATPEQEALEADATPEEQLISALVQRDATALASLLDDDFEWITAHGHSITTLKGCIASLHELGEGVSENDSVAEHRLTPRLTRTTVRSATMVSTGLWSLTQNDGWRLIARQSTLISA